MNDHPVRVEEALKLTKIPEDFYDHGWNARVRNEPYHARAGRNWKTGWKDCDSASVDQQTEMD